MFLDKDIYLFDLDGTLLTIEVEEFLQHYFKALSVEFKDLCQNREEFIQALMQATKQMIKNQGQQTNRQVFMDKFSQLVGLAAADTEQLEVRFNNFYQNEFADLDQYFTIAREKPAAVINYLKNKGKRLVLATNPLFPPAGVKARLSWAGIDAADFELLTTYDNMSHAKPNPDYYREILTKIGAEPDDCLMIGNDPQEDGSATELGIELLLIEDFLIPRDKVDYPVSWQGSMAEFKRLIETKL
ncbi:HAD family hydrolase [Halanaerobium salsuginis]|uniref:FMN phosphatase YigB, HAD superfamily n=1 Tax=Halanaerobium salsuginis TaxID=29563 RepID=A0A1I4M0K0_9FIRM|nr:HAD family hydrolase [Halanaerobium salsuginis]SFL96633.1 FMN phosphatase YigB, HAD superfamily [Halanaerobium salsuginis]